MCSVVVLPVVAHDPMLVAVYAIAMGPAQAVSNVAVSMSRIRISLLILHDLAPQVKATGRSRIDAVVTSGSRVLGIQLKIFPLPLCGVSIMTVDFNQNRPYNTHMFN